jgi:hypothetical protein
VLAVLATLIAVLPAAAHAGSSVRAVHPSAGASDGDLFTPVAPTRIYDAVQPVGQTSTVPVTGTLGATGAQITIPSDATAVVVNLTGTAATAPLYVTAYPTQAGSSPPLASQLNLAAGQTAADLVTVQVGSGGTIGLLHSAGSVRLILDIAGYYSASGSDTYVPVSPHRAYDSGTAHELGRTPQPVSRAALGLPADAQAVVVNLTAAAPSALTYVTAWSGGSRPVVSDLNVARGETRANLATVTVGAGGLDLYSNAGAVRIVVDVEGWYDASPTGSTFVPMAPVRIDPGTTPLGPGGVVDEPLETRDGVPAGASAVVLTLTTDKVDATTYEQAYPTPSGTAAPPLVSNVNVVSGATDPNLVIVATGAGGAVRLRNNLGSASDIVDLAGYFLPMPAGNDVSAHQCSDGGTGTGFPNPPDSSFGIINPTAGDLAFSGVNPCLSAEDTWARGTGDESFYLALSNKGPTSPNWPTDNGCAGTDSPACAHEFGENQAQDVYADAGAAASSATTWWLDVEESAPWQTTGSAAQPLNAQVVAGAQAYLLGLGAHVGLYSTGMQWNQLIGTSSGFTALPEWYPNGGISDQQLALNCSTPFAGGPVTLVQDIGTGGALDRDLRC